MYTITLNITNIIGTILYKQLCVIGGTNGFEMSIKQTIGYGYIMTFKSDRGINYTKLINELSNVCESHGVDYVSLITDES